MAWLGLHRGSTDGGMIARAVVVAVIAVMGLGGCAVAEDSDSVVDRAALLQQIHDAGEQRDTAAVTWLVETLDADDPAVRMLAIGALERITGQRLGYRPFDDRATREPAILRWVKYAGGRSGQPTLDGDGRSITRSAPDEPEAPASAARALPTPSPPAPSSSSTIQPAANVTPGE